MGSIALENLRRKQEAENAEDAYVKSSRFVPTNEEMTAGTQIIKDLASVFNSDILYSDDAADIAKVEKKIKELCERYGYPSNKRNRILQYVKLTAFGYGPLTRYMEDADVSEIIAQSPSNIIIKKHGVTIKTDASFASEADMATAIQRIVQSYGGALNVSNPMSLGALKDGSRVTATCPPISTTYTLNIRRHIAPTISMKDYIDSKSIAPQMGHFLRKCIECRANILISGGTDAGKTTFLNMLTEYIPREQLIVTIEDTQELNIRSKNVRTMLTRPSNTPDKMNITQATLLQLALRQTPDRIIQGEARDESIVDMFDIMSSGHPGTLGTIHSDNPTVLVNTRIPNLYRLKPQSSLSDRAIASQISYALDVIVQLNRLPNGRRVVTYISAVFENREKESNGYVDVRDIYTYDRVRDCFVYHGVRPPKVLEKMRDSGIPEQFINLLLPELKEGEKEQILT